jgi:hypothetical protein
MSCNAVHHKEEPLLLHSLGDHGISVAGRNGGAISRHTPWGVFAGQITAGCVGGEGPDARAGSGDEEVNLHTLSMAHRAAGSTICALGFYSN